MRVSLEGNYGHRDPDLPSEILAIEPAYDDDEPSKPMSNVRKSYDIVMKKGYGANQSKAQAHVRVMNHVA